MDVPRVPADRGLRVTARKNRAKSLKRQISRPLSDKPCKDCEPGSKRPARYPGPRCYSHHRKVVQDRSKAVHGRYIEETYGITEEQYDSIYESQGGVCAICRRARGTGYRRLAVDHDHRTGEVRGLLCKPCNRDVLGHLRDDREALLRAVEYLTNPPARKVLTDGSS